MSQVIATRPDLLPADPKDGDIVVSPDGSPMGELVSILVYREGDGPIGQAQAIERVTNVSFKSILKNCATRLPLKKDDQLLIVVNQYLYDSIIYTEFYGWGLWSGKGPKETKTAWSCLYKVTDFLSVMDGNGFCVYPQVYVEKIGKGETDETAAENAARNDAAGDVTTGDDAPGDGPTSG